MRTGHLVPALLLAGVLAGCGDPPRHPKEEPNPVKTAFAAEAAFAGAIKLAQEDRPALDPMQARRQVDALGVEIGKEVRYAQGSSAVGEAIARIFFGVYDYGADPKDPGGKLMSSFDLPLVLERRRGACLPLTISMARAAQGAGVLAGVALAPGHAFVVIGPPSDRVYLDPAQRGMVRRWSDVGRLQPWSPVAAELYDGRPLEAREVLALCRASRAAIRLEAGKLAEAEADARAALEVIPDLPEALVNLAAVMLKRKGPDDLDEAEERLEKAYELLPRNAAVLYNLGLLKAAQGDTRAAIQHFEAALQVDSGMEAARANKEALERKKN